MRIPGLLMATLLLPLLAAPATRAAAPGRTQWKLATFTWIKRVPAEPGAPANTQPATVTEASLTATLAPVLAQVDDQTIPLFAPDELQGLVKALGEALALAQPGEDLILLSTHKRGGGFLAQAVGLTARLFVRDGALNLIVRDARLSFMDRYAAENTLPTFAYGSRTQPSEARLSAPGATQRRGDWLVLPLAVPESVKAAAPVPAAAPAPIAAPAPLAAPAPAAPHDAAYFEAQRERLKALKQLRDEGLLTEAEYQAKREAIVKAL